MLSLLVYVDNHIFVFFVAYVDLIMLPVGLVNCWNITVLGLNFCWVGLLELETVALYNTCCLFRIIKPLTMMSNLS